jgi:hypothetical protein
METEKEAETDTKTETETDSDYASDQVINIFEKSYPDDKRPREAIEAAKKVISEDTQQNRNAAANAAANKTEKKLFPKMRARIDVSDYQKGCVQLFSAIFAQLEIAKMTKKIEGK